MNHRTRWTTALATSLAAAVAAITLGWGGAAAASQVTASENAAVARAAAWHTHSYYERLSECQAVGRYLVASGQYKAWACEDWGFWALRVLD